jgi:integrase
MPRRAKWRRDGTSATPKPIDMILDARTRLQISSGVVNRTAYELRVAAIKEAWGKGGAWRQAVLALKARRFDVAAFYAAREAGTAGIEALLARAGSEPLAGLVRDYLKQSSAGDRAKMRQRLARFQAYLGKSAVVADVTSATVEAFLTQLTDLRTVKTTKALAKGSTVNRYRAVIGGLSTWAVKVGRMPAHPIAGKAVEKRAEPHHRLPELSADEYRDYMATVRAARPDLAVVLLLLIHTAPDVGELLGVMAKDVDLEQGRMRYERSKTKRFGPAPRYVPMPAVVVAEVRGHLAEYGVRGSDLLFGMVKRAEVEWLHRHAVASIKRPELTLKDLRHVAAIAWVKAGVHIRLVQRFLGHKSLSMTTRYTDYEPGAEQAVEMAEKAAATLTATADVTPLRRAQ